MPHGVRLEVVWFDQDLIEISLTCSNGYFSGTAEIYLNHDGLPKFADALFGFPSHLTDTRRVELGTFDASCSDGGMRMLLYCADSSGHSAAEIQLRGGGCKALGELESVALRMSVEAAGIDSFVSQIKRMEATIGAGAYLSMAICEGNPLSPL